MKKLMLNIPTFGFIVATRAMLGVGIGMLASSRMPPEKRRTLGLTLAGIGAAATIPAIIALMRARDDANRRLINAVV